MLAFLAAVIVLKQKESDYSLIRPANLFQWLGLNKDRLAPYAFFGVALGLAAASKINALAVAFLLPWLYFLKIPKDSSNRHRPVGPNTSCYPAGSSDLLPDVPNFPTLCFQGPRIFRYIPR
jgi:hypothetical protein